jgi:hypothetical protein
MPIPSDDLQRTLIRKLGFEEVGGSDHDWIALVIADREVAKTKFSRGARHDIGDRLLSQIARQLYLMPRDLKRIHDCTMSKEDYLKHLRQEGKNP